MNVCIFEDEKTKNFYPLTLSRPIYDLLVGCESIEERIRRRFPDATVFYHTRNYLTPFLREAKKQVFTTEQKLGQCLFINGRSLLNPNDTKKMSKLLNTAFFNNDGSLIAIHLDQTKVKEVEIHEQQLVFPLDGAQKLNVSTTALNYLWDIIHHNPEYITESAKEKFQLGNVDTNAYPGVHFISPKDTHVGKNVIIKPSAVLDAEKGPIVLEDGVEVMHQATLIGPLYIGKKTKVKIGAKLYGGSSIGPVCKIGGEVEESIIQDYTNKQHEGFLGHAYIGSWCNLGADTNNSDLKNNYGTVDVMMNGEKIDTGQTFVGLFMGDHSKTGINTMFNTGTVVGFSCNVFGAGYLPKYIPSFSWFDAQAGSHTYKLDKACEVAGRVMARRDIPFTASQKKLFDTIYKLTEKER